MPESTNDQIRASKNVVSLLKKHHRFVKWDELAAVAGVYTRDELAEFMKKTAKLTNLRLEEKGGKWRIGPKEK